eukprot:6125298-Prymnesium_polylepis.1
MQREEKAGGLALRALRQQRRRHAHHQRHNEAVQRHVDSVEGAAVKAVGTVLQAKAEGGERPVRQVRGGRCQRRAPEVIPP